MNVRCDENAVAVRWYLMASGLAAASSSVTAFAVWAIEPSRFDARADFVLLFSAWMVFMSFTWVMCRTRYLELDDVDFNRIDIRAIDLRPRIRHPWATLRRLSVRVLASLAWTLALELLPRRSSEAAVGVVLGSGCIGSMLVLRSRVHAPAQRTGPSPVRAFVQRRVAVAFSGTVAWLVLLGWASARHSDPLRLAVLLLAIPVWSLSDRLLRAPIRRIRGSQHGCSDA